MKKIVFLLLILSVFMGSSAFAEILVTQSTGSDNFRTQLFVSSGYMQSPSVVYYRGSSVQARITKHESNSFGGEQWGIEAYLGSQQVISSKSTRGDQNDGNRFITVQGSNYIKVFKERWTPSFLGWNHDEWHAYTVNFFQDNTPPKLAVSTSSSEWTRDPVVISASASDYGAGVMYINYKIGTSGSWQRYSLPIARTSGEPVYFMAADRLGNMSSQQVVYPKSDKVAPKLTLSLKNWDRSTNRITVSASVSDNSYGSGIDYRTLEFRTGFGSWVASGSQYTTSMGATIYCRVKDKAGNYASANVRYNTVDRELSRRSFDNGSFNYWLRIVGGDFLIAEANGVRTIFYGRSNLVLEAGKVEKFNSFPFYRYSIELLLNGQRIIDRRDNEGNSPFRRNFSLNGNDEVRLRAFRRDIFPTNSYRTLSEDRIRFLRDTTPPKILVHVFKGVESVPYPRAYARVHAWTIEDQTGISRFEYRIGSGPWKPYTTSIKLFISQDVFFRATDGLENYSTKVEHVTVNAVW